MLFIDFNEFYPKKKFYEILLKTYKLIMPVALGIFQLLGVN